ncbi:MAG: glucosyl-3-phosphoglycerate synthase [Pseudonocardia sediminis]
MHPVAEAWFAHRTWQTPSWTVDELVAAKNGRRVCVVLPALDEAATVGEIVTAIATLTTGAHPLVDELVVMDSGSTDRTCEIAASAGARVVLRTDVLPDLPPLPGKGEVLWRSLAATTGEIVCYLDSDLIDFDPGFIVALLGPLLCADGIHLVKGFYRRPLQSLGAEAATGGGRVTELLVRPLLTALRPELTGVIQPLGGEYAATRDLLESVPFAPGYGVETGLLLDTCDLVGLDAIAQVNLGVRRHRNQTLLQLGVMARQILASAALRCQIADGRDGITQFVQVDGEWLASTTTIDAAERPPMRQVLDRDPEPRRPLPPAGSHRSRTARY